MASPRRPLLSPDRDARRCLLAACLVSLASLPLAGAEIPLALRGVNPDMLSGGAYLLIADTTANSEPARAAALYPDASKGQPPTALDARVGPNVRLGDDPDELPATQRGQAEPHVFRSSTNPELLLATFQEGRFSNVGGALSCGYALSRDGGLSWTRALIPRLSRLNGGAYFRATDPVAAIGPQGDLYLNTLAAVDVNFALGAVLVSRSTDQGASWSSPFVVFQSPNAQTFPDKNWFTVNDYPGTPTSGRIAVTWTNFTSDAAGNSTGSPIVAAVSDDRGATWTTPVAITPAGTRQQGTQPVFFPDGSLGVVYITFLTPGDVRFFSIQYKRSADGGRSFPDTATSVMGFVTGWDDPDIREGIFLPSAATARQTGELFVSYVAATETGPRVMLVKSADRGTTWSAPAAVSDQPVGVSVVNPAVAASPDGRTVSIVYLAKRTGPDGRSLIDHFAALSFDGGATWQRNLRLNDRSSDLLLGTQTPRGVMLGDYLGIAPAVAPDVPAVAVWCETRTGNADPFAVRFVPAPAPSFETWRIAQFGRAELAASTQSGPAADFDQDGHPNLAEYGQATDPRQPASGNALIVDGNRSQAAIYFSERTTGDVTARLESSPDGQSWQPVDPFSPLVHAIAGPPPPTLLRGGTYAFPNDRATFVRQTFTLAGTMPITVPTAERLVINGDARLVNLATRGRVNGSASPLIVGFVIDGEKNILIRAAGPALVPLGVTGAIADPQLALSGRSTGVATMNDNWQQGTAAPALFARLGAFAFPADSRDAALTQVFARDNYNATASSTAGAGVALVEAYDADPSPGAPTRPRLLNVSTRSDTGSGENALTAGFVLGGTQPRRVLLRGIGPGLAAFGVANPLADPVITLFRGNAAIAGNDDWEIARSPIATAAAARNAGAFALNAASLDAALLVTLEPGGYTAVLSSADGNSGPALVEVYDVD